MVKGVQSIAIKQLEKHNFEKKKIYNNYICPFNLVALMKKNITKLIKSEIRMYTILISAEL